MDPMKPTFSPNAPSASNPGQGSGNIPFAPGMASGKFNGPPPPPARAFPRNPVMATHPGNQGAPQGPAGQPSQGPTPPPGGPGGPPGGMPFGMNPEAGFTMQAAIQITQRIYESLWNAANSAQGSGGLW